MDSKISETALDAIDKRRVLFEEKHGERSYKHGSSSYTEKYPTVP